MSDITIVQEVQKVDFYLNSPEAVRALSVIYNTPLLVYVQLASPGQPAKQWTYTAVEGFIYGAFD